MLVLMFVRPDIQTVYLEVASQSPPRRLAMHRARLTPAARLFGDPGREVQMRAVPCPEGDPEDLRKAVAWVGRACGWTVLGVPEPAKPKPEREPKPKPERPRLGPKLGPPRPPRPPRPAKPRPLTQAEHMLVDPVFAEKMRAAGRKGGAAGGPKSSKITNAMRRLCLTCGMTCPSGPMSRHIRASGHEGWKAVS